MRGTARCWTPGTGTMPTRCATPAGRIPDDPDIAALYVEAAITCTPRKLWNLQTGEPDPDARTMEAMPVLERWMDRIGQGGPVHPGIPHMYIHTLEMSPFPERALNAADMLRGYAPDAGHMEHMPAHIYVLCGDFAQSVLQSERAVRADDRYLAYAGDGNFYTTARCHDLHLFMYAAMFLGQHGRAAHAAERIRKVAKSELIARSAPFMASILDGHSAMCTHVAVRFGRWRELAASQRAGGCRRCARSAPPCTPTGRGWRTPRSAISARPRPARAAFNEAAAAIPEDAIFLSNTVRDMLRVGEAMLDGELEYRKGNHDRAFESLRLAVSSATTRSTTPSPGPGCIRRVTRWARCWPSRACSARPRPCSAKTSAMAGTCRAAASIPTMSGRCRGSSNAWSRPATPTNSGCCARGWTSQRRAPTSR